MENKWSYNIKGTWEKMNQQASQLITKGDSAMLEQFTSYTRNYFNTSIAVNIINGKLTESIIKNSWAYQEVVWMENKWSYNIKGTWEKMNQQASQLITKGDSAMLEQFTSYTRNYFNTSIAVNIINGKLTESIIKNSWAYQEVVKIEDKGIVWYP